MSNSPQCPQKLIDATGEVTWIVGLATSSQKTKKMKVDHHPQRCVKRRQQYQHRPRLNLGPVSWRPMTVKWQQFSQSNRHSTICTRQTEYHEALPSSANDEVRCDCTFADDGNASWYSICREPMVERRLDWKLLSPDGHRPPWYRPLVRLP